ncbi:DinB family protein [Mucilaginibacter ginsenosidivorans]|uniref:DinB family protein n=1 Tax=Mucilaginibacter ginsenosidivorans TaxID=398053 RepID=A0A5B8UXR2_9SPHI|nr:DinB family protein [Mucilaginibacter ginsenosidivorans]QEC63749.1 DinB family protein [Mucilaginibacter ginsenosidivorans]
MLYSSLVCRLKSQHLALSEIVNHLDEKQLNRQPEPGKWSIKDNIAHMVTYQPVFMARVHQILKGGTPAFNAYRADNEPDFIAARELPLNELMRKLMGNRRQILELITNLTDDDLLLQGTHPKYGTLTITEWTEFFLLHEAHHLFTIFRLAKG